MMSGLSFQADYVGTQLDNILSFSQMRLCGHVIAYTFGKTQCASIIMKRPAALM